MVPKNERMQSALLAYDPLCLRRKTARRRRPHISAFGVTTKTGSNAISYCSRDLSICWNRKIDTEAHG